VAGTLLATACTFWFTSTVTEVYTAHVLIALAVLWAADRVHHAAGRTTLRRAIMTLAALCGVGLAHHPTIVLVFPAAAALAWRRRERSGRKVEAQVSAGSAAWLLAGVLALHPAVAYGSLRAHAGPRRRRGTTSRGGADGSRDRAAYRPSIWDGRACSVDGWKHVLLTLARDLGLVGLALAGRV
jgi:hypothetical protein